VTVTETIKCRLVLV